EVENIHRNLAMDKPLTRAILDGAQQIAVPAFVSTLSICVVFVPVLLLTGAAKFLFTPLAAAVVFAMLTSYLLSRTLIPSMVHFLLPKEAGSEGKGKAHGASGRAHGRMRRIGDWVDRRFTKLRDAYKDSLEWTLGNRAWIAGIFAAFFVLSALLLFFVGRDFFPYVDSGQMRLHVRAPAGTRLEETERIFAAVEREIRKQVPPAELQAILDNIGLPPGGINLAFGDTATTGPHDGEILIALNKKHSPTPEHERRLRDALAKAFPEEVFFFGAANITNQILNFGVQAPIDVQVTGRDEHNYGIATQLSEEIAKIPGVVDVHLGQQRSSPTVGVEVDRLKAGEAGLTQRDVANSVLISLSGTGQVAPTQWLNPQNGVSYQVSVQTPQYRIDSFDALARTPITAASGAAPAQLLGNLATFKRETSTGVVSHYDVQPVFDVYANVDRSDMGTVAAAIDKVIKKYEPKVAQGNRIRMRGQVATMRESFTRLEIGIVFALLFVYLIMAVNFQSWIDPLIILMAIPGTFAGILWMLFITQTTFSVPSLMGAIMAIGVAS
ncbi:MAG TPA: efflux RND transporter permease subunit, partial [Usitatibacter sp.]|nr:efflux RND transporter permease subunit [Usitatibacter sp.]